jgi:hypothetical protein
MLELSENSEISAMAIEAKLKITTRDATWTGACMCCLIIRTCSPLLVAEAQTKKKYDLKEILKDLNDPLLPGALVLVVFIVNTS